MSRLDAPTPLLHTPESEWNKAEQIKNRLGIVGDLPADFRDMDDQGIGAETETLAKSHGIYLEYNRAKSGKEKDWMYMIRISVPGGGAFGREHWRVIDDISRRYTTSPDGVPSIRLTTRQNIQFHWVHKRDLVQVVADIAKTGFFALNGCGDNTRNVMACPLSRFSTVYDAVKMAHRYGTYFQLPEQPHIQIFGIDTAYDRNAAEAKVGAGGRFDYGPNLLNRKFKIAFSAVHRHGDELRPDNCVELRTNDCGIAPVVEDGKLAAFQVYVGGGQGEKNGKSSFSTLGLPLGVFAPGDLHKGLDSIVKVHQEWGDRKNRHWARLKYVVHAQGIEWYQDQVRAAGASFEKPIDDFDVGTRDLHHGWTTQENNGNLTYGLYVENGRLIDRDPNAPTQTDGAGSTAGNGEQLQSLVRHMVETYDTELLITPNQDLLFTDLDPAVKEDFEADLKKFRYGTRRNGKVVSRLRTLSGACVGLPTCRLSYTESEQFEPELLDKLEEMGYGDVGESIGITGCERQCFRPGTKTIGWVGQGPDMYMLKIGGDEAGRHQGTPIADGDKLYLRQVKRDDVPTVTAALFDSWKSDREDGEDLGAFHRRIGHLGVLQHLRDNPKTAHVTQKTAPASYDPIVNGQPVDEPTMTAVLG